MNQIKLQVKIPVEYSKPSLVRTAITIGSDWLMIFGCAAIASVYSNILIILAAQLIIASRQHALFLLMHEATHFLLCVNNKWNDRISNFFVAWPIGFSTERYRKRHWVHHRFLNTDDDPDWVRKKLDPTWSFPSSKWHFWKTTIPHMMGKGVIEMYYALRVVGVCKSELSYFIPYAACIFAAVSYLDLWKAILLFWIVPYMSFMPFFQRVRNASEHLALPKSNSLDGTRNIVNSAVESFFFSPHQGNLHLIHHQYPYIPWYRLHLVREILLKDPIYKSCAHENTTYFLPSRASVFRDFTITNAKEALRRAA